MSQKWSREIVIYHILERHRKGYKLNSDYMQKYCNPLYQAGCNYFGSWRKSIEATGLCYDDVRILHRHRPVWSKRKIVAVIQRRSRLGQALNSNHIQTREPRLYGASVKYFGGWSQAVSAAGIDYMLQCKVVMRNWSKKAIVEEIQRRFEQGLSIKGADVSCQDRGLYQVARRYFGKNGWAKARLLAGFKAVDPLPWKIWDKQSICEAILKLYNSGVDLSTISMQKGSHAHVLSSACKVFGSWAKAIKATGLDYSKIQRTCSPGWWTKERILNQIKALNRKRKPLNHKIMQKSNAALVSAAIARFGSWRNAVEATGISYRLHCRTWSTKAWLRDMTGQRYESTIKLAKKHAQKRRNE